MRSMIRLDFGGEPRVKKDLRLENAKTFQSCA
jgi:hypothetical protein